MKKANATCEVSRTYLLHKLPGLATKKISISYIPIEIQRSTLLMGRNLEFLILDSH